jgi:hypothetical protein
MSENEMNPIDEDRLRTELGDFSVAYQRPASQIRIRGHRIRRRRQLAIAAVAAAIISAVATPSVAIFQDLQVQPAEDPQEPDCPDSYVERFWRASDQVQVDDAPSADVADPSGVPDDLRLLWPVALAAAADAASATDTRDRVAHLEQLYDRCAELPDDSVSLVWETDGRVTRAFTIERLASIAFATELGADLAVGPTDVFVHEHSNGQRISWTREGHTWSVTGGPITHEEIPELVRSIRYTTDGEIDFSGWSLPEKPTHVSRGSNQDAAEVAGVVSYEVVGKDVGMEVDTSPVSFWSLSYPGARVISVNGSPALVVADAEWVTWQPEPGVTVRLYNHSGLSEEELLTIAEQVAPVEASDLRLAAVWRP